jgi:hypothetical protein
MPRTNPSGRTFADSLKGFFAVPFRSQTYLSIAYLLLAFPLGLAYFVAVTVGLSMGVGLLVTLVGVPILLATLYGVTLIGGFEASLARRLLGVDVQAPTTLRDGGRDGSLDVDAALSWIRRVLTAPTTWTALVLVGVKFVFGTVAFVVLTVAVVLVGTLVFAPLFVGDPTLTYGLLRPVGSDGGLVAVSERGAAEALWAVDSVPEAVGVTVFGLLALLVALHFLNGLARLGGLLTAALLDVGQPSEGAESTA